MDQNQNSEKMQRGNKQKIKDLLFFIISLIGIGCLSYPFYADYQLNQSKKLDIQTYKQTSRKSLQKQIEEMEQELIVNHSSSETIQDPFSTSKFDTKQSELPKMFGILEIPKINLEVPIYPTTSNLVLEKGVGILEGSSLPTGGLGNHAVLTGHSGLSLSQLFTDLAQLQLEDHFYINYMGQINAYEVDRILTIEPNDLSHFSREEDQDYITLVTCTPLGINSHRLLVRGHRIPYDAEVKENEKSYFLTFRNIIIFIMVVFFSLFVSIILFKYVPIKKVI